MGWGGSRREGVKWIVVRRMVRICVGGSEMGIRYHLIKRRRGGGFGGNEIHPHTRESTGTFFGVLEAGNGFVCFS